MKSLGIYVQIPFCSSKCSFCNFSSQVTHSSLFDRYCCCLLDDIGRLPAIHEQAGLGSRITIPGLLALPLNTIYFGGGTPSLLGPERLRGIVVGIERRFGINDGLEFTIEVTPGSAGGDLLRGLRSLGVNRLSI